MTIPIVNDVADEGSEIFNVRLNTPTGGTLGALRNSLVIIGDDDTGGQLQFANAVFSVTENGGLATITVMRSGGSSGAVTVKYQTTLRSATTADFTSIPLTSLSFANGETATTVWFSFWPSAFGIFDAFPGESGRQAHPAGQIAAALIAKAPELLSPPPIFESVDVLAAKLYHSLPGAIIARRGTTDCFRAVPRPETLREQPS